MRNPFLDFDMNYGRPFTPRPSSRTGEMLFMEDNFLPPASPNPFQTPFEKPIQEPVLRRTSPIGNSYNAEGLFMEPDERERMFRSPLETPDPSLLSLVMMALLRNMEKKRRREGTIEKEGKPKQSDNKKGEKK